MVKLGKDSQGSTLWSNDEEDFCAVFLHAEFVERPRIVLDQALADDPLLDVGGKPEVTLDLCPQLSDPPLVANGNANGADILLVILDVQIHSGQKKGKE